MTQRRAVTKEMAVRYETATKTVKGAMLDELCALTGWSRRHAARALIGGGSVTRPRRRVPRARTYDDEVRAALIAIWKVAGGPCGKRLAPFMGTFVGALERHGELRLAPWVREKVLAMSAATIDRTTAAERKRLQIRGRHGTKPGTMLKHQIPIRTYAEWDDARPGFCEMDLVAHDGGQAAGEFVQTLDLTDIVSGWTEMAAVRNKAQKHVFAAIETIAERLPFMLRGLDSDNGSEFINAHLLTWCRRKRITFTRSRPYRKNDNCFVEQKNWTHVRQQVGYARYEGDAHVALLNELYAVLRLWLNFFAPQQRLVSKERSGAKVTRRYDVAATPYERLLASRDVAPHVKRRLRAQFETLNPAALSREIARLQRRLIRAGLRPQALRAGTPTDAHPWKRGDLGAPLGGGRRPVRADPRRPMVRRTKEGVRLAPDPLATRTSTLRQRRVPTRTS